VDDELTRRVADAYDDEEYRRQRRQREARRRLDEEDAGRSFTRPPYRRTLTDELAVPDDDVHYRISSVWPLGGNAVLSAQFKTGKTTLGINAALSLADGLPVLGRLPVTPPSGRVGYLNYEVTDAQFRRWMRDVGITQTGRVAVLNLRGYRVPILSPAGEDFVVEWAKDCSVETLIADPWGRLMVGSGSENSNDDVRLVTDALDVVKQRAGISDLLVITHTGRMQHEEGAERARGATALDDWADARWLLTKQNGVRYFAAPDGRDVEFAEEALDFDPATRRLSVIGTGSRKQNRDDLGVQAVAEYVRDNDGCRATDLRNHLKDALGIRRDEDCVAVIKKAQASGFVYFEKVGTAHRYHASATYSEEQQRRWADDQLHAGPRGART
jgi:hypothetical protein